MLVFDGPKSIEEVKSFETWKLDKDLISHLELDAGGEQMSDQRVVALFECETELLRQRTLLLLQVSDPSLQRRDLQHQPATNSSHLSDSNTREDMVAYFFLFIMILVHF